MFGNELSRSFSAGLRTLRSFCNLRVCTYNSETLTVADYRDVRRGNKNTALSHRSQLPGSTRAQRVPRERARNLNGTSAGSAEMRASGARCAALRTEASHAGRNIVHVMWPVGSDGPNKCCDPSDQRPAKKKIQQKNAGSVRFVFANNRRQEIKKYDKQEAKHVADSFESARGNWFCSSQ